jgi:hypothetical protein
MKHINAISILDSLVVTTIAGIMVKVVFEPNRNIKSECLYLLSSECSLSGIEFLYRIFDGIVIYLTIVFTTSITLEWIRINLNDQKLTAKYSLCFMVIYRI